MSRLQSNPKCRRCGGQDHRSKMVLMKVYPPPKKGEDKFYVCVGCFQWYGKAFDLPPVKERRENA